MATEGGRRVRMDLHPHRSSATLSHTLFPPTHQQVPTAAPRHSGRWDSNGASILRTTHPICSATVAVRLTLTLPCPCCPCVLPIAVLLTDPSHRSSVRRRPSFALPLSPSSTMGCCSCIYTFICFLFSIILPRTNNKAHAQRTDSPRRSLPRRNPSDLPLPQSALAVPLLTSNLCAVSVSSLHCCSSRRGDAHGSVQQRRGHLHSAHHPRSVHQPASRRHAANQPRLEERQWHQLVQHCHHCTPLTVLLSCCLRWLLLLSPCRLHPRHDLCLVDLLHCADHSPTGLLQRRHRITR